MSNLELKGNILEMIAHISDKDILEELRNVQVITSLFGRLLLPLVFPLKTVIPKAFGTPVSKRIPIAIRKEQNNLVEIVNLLFERSLKKLSRI